MNDSVLNALVRSQLYAALARGFAEPPRTLADWQKGTGSREELPAAAEKLPQGEALGAAMRGLEQARAAVASEGALEELRAHYVDLFGNLRSQQFPPYETEYTGGGDFRKNQDLADLMGFYHAFGLHLADESRRERPDHISVELEFLHFLCWKEAAARWNSNQEHISVCVDAERNFLRDHLGSWAELFACGVERTAPVEFYRTLAALLRALLAEEVLTLGVALEPAAEPLPRPREGPDPMSCGGEAPASLVQISGGG